MWRAFDAGTHTDRVSPTQICHALPMLVVEVQETMTTATKKRTRIDRLDEGEWLIELLADVRAEVASYPKPQAIARIRERLYAEIETPARAAA